MKNEGSPVDWMLALPLYHFLKGQSEPFGEPGTSVMWERDMNLGLSVVKQKVNKLEK